MVTGASDPHIVVAEGNQRELWQAEGLAYTPVAYSFIRVPLLKGSRTS